MAPLQAQRPNVERAFERLYRRHALDVYRYAMAVLRNQADAEDVTQTTFMNAYRALERGDTPASPHNWLIAIAHNVCRQRFRAQSRRVREVGIDDDIADHFVAPEDDNALSAEDIRRALGHLAFNQRAALVMRELEGRSYAEIADLLGLSVSAVETLIFRARRALREQLDGTLTCGQAEQLLSKQLDLALAKPDRAQLRAHLRECAACRTHARSQRAQRSAIRALGALPLPQSLASLLGGAAPVATKVAAAVVTAGVAGGIGYDVHRQLAPAPTKPSPPARHVVVPTPIVARAQVVGTPKSKHAMPPRHVVRATPRKARTHVTDDAPAAAATVVTAAARTHKPKPPVVQPKRARPAHPVKPVRAKSHGHTRGRPVDPGSSGQRPRKPEHPANARNAAVPDVADLPGVTTADDLTQSSQRGGARKTGEGHLHP
jgi:RNA polymerase sigma-70 factor (ECF subfamily)